MAIGRYRRRQCTVIPWLKTMIPTRTTNPIPFTASVIGFSCTVFCKYRAETSSARDHY